MLPWRDVPERDITDITQYIKTLSPKWQEDDAVGEPVEGEDPQTRKRRMKLGEERRARAPDHAREHVAHERLFAKRRFGRVAVSSSKIGLTIEGVSSFDESPYRPPVTRGIAANRGFSASAASVTGSDPTRSLCSESRAEA